jgi:hypothetical protein
MASPAAKGNVAHILKLLQTTSDFPAGLDNPEIRRCCIRMLILFSQKVALDSISAHVLAQPVISNIDAHIESARFVARIAEVAVYGKGLASSSARVFHDSMVRAMRAVALQPSVRLDRRHSVQVDQLLGSIGQYFHHYIVNLVRAHDIGKGVPDYSVIVIPFLCIYNNCRRNAALTYCFHRGYSTKKRGVLEGLLSSIHRWLLEITRKHGAAGGLQQDVKIDFDLDDAYEAVVRRLPGL